MALVLRPRGVRVNDVSPEHQETPDINGAYPRLSSSDVQRLLPHGELRRMSAGEVLFSAGEVVSDFIVICSGLVAILDNDEGQEHVIRVHGSGRFLGDLGLLEGQPVLYSARAATDGELLAVPFDALVKTVSRDQMLGEEILKAYLIRRLLLVESDTGIRIIGSCYTPETRRLLEFTARNRLPHRLIDLDKDASAESFLQKLGVTVDETPLVIVAGRHVLRNPSLDEVAVALGLRAEPARTASYDLLVIGAGPAGLAATVYAASDGLDVLLVDAFAPGGQAATSSLIENYLGFPAGISGAELAERAILQTRKFGATLTVPAEATSLRGAADGVTVGFGDGREVTASAAVIASGVKYRRLVVEGIEKLEPSSVYYAATVHEASVCRADPVALVGGGNSAGQAALFLASHSPSVTLVVREETLSENMSRYLTTQIEQHHRIEVLLHSEVVRVEGEGVLTAVTVVNNHTGQLSEIPARALFVFIGASPHTGWLSGAVDLDDRGYVLTGADVRLKSGAAPALRRRGVRHLETSMPRVFAVGDVRSGSVKRVTSAMGEGAMSIGTIHQYLAGGHGLLATDSSATGNSGSDNSTIENPQALNNQEVSPCLSTRSPSDGKPSFSEEASRSPSA
jgi:thioredoxin reductase (NADPH)